MKITMSIGNFSGRRWLLKKWIVKMKATASRASSPWIRSATLKSHPGRIFENSHGNQSRSPEPPMMNIPQKTAQ